jgi:DNA-binding NarL/FixJ family response regulator
VIGFLHADRVGQRSSITPGDLESIAVFAAELGVLFERAVLAERMERQRAEVGAALRSAVAGIDALCDADLALGSHAPSLPPGGDHRAEGPAPRRDALLTDREREVVELIASGATNEAVARELVLSADTVKTHVSSILRKLDVASRAEAVARYLDLRARDDGGPAR